MYGGYGYFNSTEIWNNQRVVAYLKGAPEDGIEGLALPSTSLSADCGCDALPLYCDQGSGVGGAYRTPRLDDAPWFDSGIPDSEEFAGFFVTDITGFDSTVRREFTEGALSGGSLGPIRLGGRCMTVTGWLLAKSCCGAEYGLRWLNEALIGNNFCDDCGYGDLYMIKCCPPEGDTCYTVEESVTETDSTATVWFTITDNGDGTYEFVVDDSNQANMVSDPAGAPNNTDGPIPTCYGAGYSFRFVVENTIGALYTFLVPFETITAFATAPSGSGASATFTVDTNVEGSCDDVVNDILNFTTQIETYLASETSGVAIQTTTPTQVRCFSTNGGYNPTDYVRLLHRVGLVDGPKVIERRGACCSNDCGCVNIKVQFTMCSESPHIFSDIEWCVQDQTFDLVDCYCYDTRKLCNNCSTNNDTKLVDIEVARPECEIDVLHDGTWCPVGWDVGEEGCPPDQCLLTINDVVAYDPEEVTDCEGSATDNDPCIVGLYDDFTWIPINFEMADGFPPQFCDLAVLFGGTCDDANPNNCLIRLVYNEATGSQTWEPIRWSGNLPIDPECDCVEIAEVCVINDPTRCEDEPSDCPINVVCSLAYLPNDCITRQATAAFFYRYNGSPPFTPPTTPTFPDVGVNSTFYTEVEWAASVGLMNGYYDGTFRPEDPASRQAMAAFFYRDAGSPAFTPPAYPSFTDVETTDTFYTEIEWAAYEGLMVGYADGSFRPTACTSRRAAAIIFYRYADIAPHFSDVPVGADFFTEIEWSRDQGIFFGYDDGTFRSGNSVLNRIMALTLYRADGTPPYVPPGVPTFADVPTTDPQYLEIEYVNSQGYMTGSGGNFSPDVATTRAEAMVIFYIYNGSPAFTPPAIPTFTDVGLAHPDYTEIEWANSVGIATGYTDFTFRPSNDATRAALAAWYYRNAGSPPFSPAIFTPPADPTFVDVPTTDGAYTQIEWLYAQGITTGYNNARFWEPIGWDHDPTAAFPPENCNFYIATVNGEEPDTSPILEQVELPYDEFVPDCGPFPYPPPSPTLFSANDCFCEPWEAARQCCTFTNPADWNEATTYIELWTGSEELRNFKVEAYRNPFGDAVPCPCDPADDFWECREPCATILVPQLPKNSKLIIDSRQRTTQLVLSSGRTLNALRFIFAEDGKPFEWFDIGQCSTFCIVAQADCRQTAADATISIGAAGRFVASGG